MKRRITLEQLAELSDKGRENLKKWWSPDIGDCYYDYDNEVLGMIYCGEEEVLGDDALPLLSFGQLLEFLKEQRIAFITGVLDKTPSEEWTTKLWNKVRHLLNNI